MTYKVEDDCRADWARADLQEAIVAAFSNTLHSTGLPPMTVMRLAAATLGAIYKAAADGHRDPGTCPCGWQPHRQADVEALQDALATAAHLHSVADLRVIPVAGRA
jgi:hypothetical protein